MKSLLAIISTLVLVGMMVGGVTGGAENDSVSATVTIGTVSVTLAPTSFGYGTMPQSGTKISFDVIDVSGDKNVKATVGSVLTDLDIKGADSTGGDGWTLAGTPGVDTYAHSFGTATNGTTVAASYAALTTSDQVLATDVAAAGVIWFGLELETPTSGEEVTQQTLPVTVTASWGG